MILKEFFPRVFNRYQSRLTLIIPKRKQKKIPLSDFRDKGFKSQKEYQKIQIIHAALLQTEKSRIKDQRAGTTSRFTKGD